MSLYNTLFGENIETPVLLGMLGVNKAYFDRFRDINLIDKGDKIQVFTRLGGGNRECYQDTWNKIQKHDLYITDYDDNFDCTYAYIDFKIPDGFKATAKKMFKGEPIKFEEKFQKELEEMDKEGTEANKRANEIVNKIIKAIESGNSIIDIIDI